MTVNPGPCRDGDGGAEVAEVAGLTVTLMRQSARIAGGLARAAGLADSDAAGLRALDVLADGDLSAGALAERLSLSNAATTGVVDRLERAGLARRAADPRDRRRIVVTLTPRARTFGEEHLAPLHRHAVAAALTLPPDQVRAVRDFLGAVVEGTAPLLGEPSVEAPGP